MFGSDSSSCEQAVRAHRVAQFDATRPFTHVPAQATGPSPAAAESMAGTACPSRQLRFPQAGQVAGSTHVQPAAAARAGLAAVPSTHSQHPHASSAAARAGLFYSTHLHAEQDLPHCNAGPPALLWVQDAQAHCIEEVRKAMRKDRSTLQQEHDTGIQRTCSGSAQRPAGSCALCQRREAMTLYFGRL